MTHAEIVQQLKEDHPDVAERALRLHANRIYMQAWEHERGYLIVPADGEGTAFSTSACPACRDSDAGSRHPVDLVDYREDGETFHADVCPDCLIWFANGEAPEALL